MKTFLSIGEAMVELSQSGGDLWRMGFAGDTLNTAWYAREMLPADWQVSYLTRLGSDPFSARLRGFLDQNGIDTRFIADDPQRSVGLYAIELHEGERSFSYWRGQSAARLLASDPTLLDAAFDAADAIYLSGITLAILPPEHRADLIGRMTRARERGKLTAFDPNIRPRLWQDPQAMLPTLMAASPASTILLPSYDDDAAHFGDSSVQHCAERWKAAGAGEVVVKNGGGPITLLLDDACTTINVTREKPVDSTGAGDSFNGAYLAARLTGIGPADAVLGAHALSVEIIRHPGALRPRNTSS